MVGASGGGAFREGGVFSLNFTLEQEDAHFLREGPNRLV